MRSQITLAAMVGAAALWAGAGSAGAASPYYSDHFKMIGYAPGSNVALWADTTRIERRGGIVTAWLLMVGPDQLDSETGKAAARADYKVIRASFDCAASTYRFTEGTYYTYDGQRVRDYAADGRWRPVASDSLAGAGERYLCRNAAIQIEMTADNLNEALRFSRKIRSGAVSY